MTSTTNSSVKPTVCRYFSNGGNCYYGADCSFTHANNAASRPSETDDFGEPLMSANNAMLDDAPAISSIESCDTYPDARMNGLPSESKLHMFLSHQRPITTPSHTLIDDKPKQSSTLHASFSNMSLDSDIKLRNQNLLPSDYTATPSTATLGTNLRQSSSSPSFMSSTMSGNMPYGRFQNLSPNVSPAITPSQSPNLHRRTKANMPNIPVNNSTDEAVNQPLYQESVGGTTYYFTPDAMSTQSNNSTNHDLVNGSVSNVIIPDYHVYHSNPSHIEHLQPKANAPSYFMPDELKFEILHNNSLMNAQVDPEQRRDLPTEVDQYHNLCPLEPPVNSQNPKTSSFAYVTSVYKATNIKTGVNYCLRRIHGFRLVNTKCMNIVEMWKKMQHSNLVQLREVFTTKAFNGEHSIVFVHDYHPNATTLLEYHFSHSNKSDSLVGGTSIYGPEGAPRPFSQSKQSSRQALLPESQLWAYIVQLSSVIRTIHMGGLACRNLDPSKILVTAKSRLRINCCGIYDVLSYDINMSNSMAHIPHFQQEDMTSFGKILLALACNSVDSIQRENMPASLELIARHYSTDLRNLIMYLMGNQRNKNVNEIMPMIGARFYSQLDSAQTRSDIIENELAKEVNNGRLVRLISKLNMINERPEFNMDHTWSETGDRYMLKLFRDYVFHLVTEDGAPWIDMAHVVQCLNKLDAGVPEKILLSSRDEQNVLVVSYAEIKQCFETSFDEIIASTRQAFKQS